MHTGVETMLADASTRLINAGSAADSAAAVDGRVGVSRDDIAESERVCEFDAADSWFGPFSPISARCFWEFNNEH